MRALIKHFSLALFWLILSVPVVAGAADIEVHPSIDQALDRLYNFDFTASHRTLDSHIAQEPNDPLGPGVKAAAYLFQELDRLRILESEFFSDDDKIISKKKLRPDPEVREQLHAVLDKTEFLARARLAADPNDVNALFALAMKEGVLADYKALVQKKGLRSLGNAKAGNKHAVRLLHINPDFYDAYLTTGVNEYLLGSLPFFIRWFVRMDGVKGSKTEAFRKLELVAERGTYFGPFAKILLSIMYLREKKAQRCARLLAELTQQYPENPLLRKELTKINLKIATGELISEGSH